MDISKQLLPVCIYVDLIGQLSAYWFQLYQHMQVILIG